MKRTITTQHQVWLTHELQAWQQQGLIDQRAADAIAGGYDVVPTKRINLARLLLTVGGAFVGIGIIWLIAANLDNLSPMVRLGFVFALYVAALLGAEVLAGKRGHNGSIPSPVVGALRLVAVLLLGGVIFQAAQSLQVPAFEMTLLGLWAIGALLHAYLMKAMMPLLVGLSTGLVWLLTVTQVDDFSGLGLIAALFGPAVLATALSHLHSRTNTQFATVWREVGAALALVGLFIAAIPPVTAEDFTWHWELVVVLVAAVAAMALAAVPRSTGLIEPLAVLAIAAAGVLLVFWEAAQDADQVGLAGWAHAGFAVTVYVAAALWVAYLGITHDSPRLTWIATGALVAFTTFQSFSVFAQIIQGAWLFVVLGLVLAGSGYFFDRARRELEANLEGDQK